MADFDEDTALGRHTRDVRAKNRDGKTQRYYQQAQDKHKKREHSTITYTAADGTTSKPLSLDKAKRWEQVEEFKEGSQYVVIEGDVNDSRLMDLERKKKERQARSRIVDRHDDDNESHSDDSAEDSEEKLKKEYRFTKGGEKGVMISKRRTPGKKGVKKNQDSQSRDSDSESSGSESGSSGEERPEGYMVVEHSSHKKVRHHIHRDGGCRCEYCNPFMYQTREEKKRVTRDELKNL